MTKVVRGVIKSLNKGGMEVVLIALWAQMMKSKRPVASDGDLKTGGSISNYS